MFHFIKKKITNIKTGRRLDQEEKVETASPASVLEPQTPSSSNLPRTSSRNSLVGLDFEHFYSQTTPPPLLARISPGVSRQASLSGDICPRTSWGSYTQRGTSRSGIVPRPSGLSFSATQRSSAPSFTGLLTHTQNSCASTNPGERSPNTPAALDPGRSSLGDTGLSLLIEEASIIPLSAYTEGEESAEDPAGEEYTAEATACHSRDGNAPQLPSSCCTTSVSSCSTPCTLHLNTCPAQNVCARGGAPCRSSQGEGSPLAHPPYAEANSSLQQEGTCANVAGYYQVVEKIGNRESLGTVVQPQCHPAENMWDNKPQYLAPS